MKNLILDMDLTIVDRGEAGDYNYKEENITSYCKKLSYFTLYDGCIDVFSFIRDKNLKIAIVSDAHERIIQGVISQFNIPCEVIVGHFTAKNKKKPNSFPMLEALRMMNETPDNAISFGDSLGDFKAAIGAGINHHACLWASQEEQLLKQNGCAQFINHPSEIIEILKK